MARPLTAFKYKKSFHPQSFIDHSKDGKCLTQIAAIWGVHRDTIYEWKKKYNELSDAIKMGKIYCEAWYVNLGQSAMVGQAKYAGQKINLNLGMYVWLTKNILKWSDKVQVEEPPQDRERPLKDLSDKELDDL